MAGEIRIRARQLQNGKVAGNMVILLAEFMLSFLLLFASFFLQYAFNNNIGELVAKAILIFAASFVLPCLFSFFRLGVVRYFFLKAESKKAKLRQTLYYFHFHRFKRALMFGLCFYLLKLLCSSFCFLPVLVFGFVFYGILSGGSSLYVAVTLFVCLVLLFAVCAFFRFKFLRLFFLSKYMFVCFEEIKVRECFKLSAKIMQKSTGSLFRLRFSFVLWFGICVFLIPFAYVWGYYEQAMAVFAQKKLEDYIKETNSVEK